MKLKKGDKVYCITSRGYKPNNIFTKDKWYVIEDVLWDNNNSVDNVAIIDDNRTTVWFDIWRFSNCFACIKELRKLKLEKLFKYEIQNQ